MATNGINLDLVPLQALCRLLVDDKELCHQPADGKAAMWQLPVQHGALAGLFDFLPSAGRWQRALHLCRLPADGKESKIFAVR
mgnify:CR=1 FL=1